MLYDYIQFSSYLLGVPCRSSTPDNQSLHLLQGKWHCSLPNDGYFYRGRKFPLFKNLKQFPNRWLWQRNAENIKFLTRSILFLFIWSVWHHKWFMNLLLILGFAYVEHNDFIISQTLISFIISTKHTRNDLYLFRNNPILISWNLLPGNKVWAWHEKWEKKKTIKQTHDSWCNLKKHLYENKLKFLTWIHQPSKIGRKCIRSSSLVPHF